MITNRQLFLQHIAQTSDAPMLLEIVKAEGLKMWDVNGKEYIDLISGISVSSIGHRHPQVVEAIKKQLDKYLHLMVYGEYVQSPQIEYAKALTSLLPENLNCCYFVNSGSEAIEGALKLAKRVTGRSKIFAFKNAYHGSTHGALSLMSDEYFTNAFRPLLPGIEFLEWNNIEGLNRIDAGTACVVTEIVRGEAGAIIADKNFLKTLSKQCSDTGALLICDEIQTGFGRTGPLFAFMDYEIVPDVLCIGKGMAGGMPMGAFVSSREMMNEFSHDPVLGHITTFGGHPVMCAAALATLGVIKSFNTAATIPAKEKLFRNKLQHEKIKSITGKGLLLAVEFENIVTNKSIIKKCIDKGVIVDWFLFAEHKMRIAPPLNITDEIINYTCEKILEAIEE
ncbi:MAG: aspartate aminotransferase family protein [Bacteroidia bacterium]